MADPISRREFLRDVLAACALAPSMLSASGEHEYNKIKSYNTVKEGLVALKDEAASIRDNLEYIIEMDDDAWKCRMDSKGMVLYGKENEDGRRQFKFDPEFFEKNIDYFINAKVKDNGAIAIDEEMYKNSDGTEFVEIKKGKIKGADSDYAIRQDKYKDLVDNNATFKNKEPIDLSVLEGAGGCKLNAPYAVDEVPNSGLLKAAVAKRDNEGKWDYEEAGRFLKDEFIPQEKRYFRNGKGTGFYINNKADNYEVQPLCVSDSIRAVSFADDIDILFNRDAACFLKKEKEEKVINQQ